MTKLEAIKELLSKVHYAEEPRVLGHISAIISGADPNREIKDLARHEAERDSEEYDAYMHGESYIA